jgi:ATP-dependent Clp protease ATP-binding subunit ClpX
MATKKTPPSDINDRCSFCNHHKEEVGRLVDSAPVGTSKSSSKICLSCSERAAKLIIESNTPKRKVRVNIDPNDVPIPAPKMFYAHLSKFVVGQERAKKRLSVGVTNHMKRLIDLDLRESGQVLVTNPEVANTVIQKSNILLIGPTGTGKTLLAQSLADYMRVPFAIGDATTLTEAGYVGEDVENLLLKLLQVADGDLEKAQRGVIYIDEIDKIHRTGHNVSITRDVSGEGVQQSLLKMIEGTMSNIPPHGGRKHPEQQYIPMDTSNILFICGGAFVGIEDIIARRVGKSSIGFGRTTDTESISDRNVLLRQIEPQDLIEYGLIPELIGRLPVVATLDELSIPDLVRVLREPENAILKQYRKLFLMEGVDLAFTDEAIGLLAEKAKAKGTGARGLKTIVEDVMTDLMFALPDYGKGKLLITSDVVNGNASPHLEVHGEAA